MILIISLFLYMIPTIVAYAKKKKNRVAVLLTNVLLGWTVIGWIAALIWACLED